MTTTFSSPSKSPPAKRLKMDKGFDTAKLQVTVNDLSATDTQEKIKTTNSAVDSPKNGKLNKEKKSRKVRKKKLPEPFSPADVLWHDVYDFLGHEYVEKILAKEDGSEWQAPEELGSYAIIGLRVDAFTVSGESLSLYTSPTDGRKWAIVTPFAHPGDFIRAKIFKHDRLHCLADLLEILEFSTTYRGGEGDRRVYPQGGCKYFGECGGCQLQPLPYEKQLLHKHRTVQLAYQRFSALPSALVPSILPTIPSPKQWAYRTKITPHFDAPPKWAKAKYQQLLKEGEETALNAEEEARQGWECRVGFERKGKPGVIDIEECPIATPILNSQLKIERERVNKTIWKYNKGATILLRDTLPAPPLPFDPSSPDLSTEHLAITDHKAEVFERVGPFLFSFAAGAFFQNNNSILLPLTQYVQDAIFPSGSTAPSPTHLVDTYCGSGLFGITLSSKFEKVAGVEISLDSIKAAKRNAELNQLEEKTTWLCGKAEDIFGGLPDAGFAGSHSCVVVDPPRKGCDGPFLDQLLNFRPLTIVYVSCNVHTQARDVGYLVQESMKQGTEAEDAKKGWTYVVESLRGFDLFPQTAHVESVAVLRLKVA
ncbi:uncharacterized protein L203_102577 [Cryptococcus depauperatus CBS 7841]|uniref:Uncharacterized protein n=1 Tax=Cryptococcus depauperatus CBS 7841 TaxID=1295531 RepID=A0A1E3IDN2_9TREE|nr:tRNA (uracil-5-)-methyltransferase [Cryptococcus depauperatus CBS 7841]